MQTHTHSHALTRTSILAASNKRKNVCMCATGLGVGPGWWWRGSMCMCVICVTLIDIFSVALALPITHISSAYGVRSLGSPPVQTDKWYEEAGTPLVLVTTHPQHQDFWTYLSSSEPCQLSKRLLWNPLKKIITVFTWLLWIDVGRCKCQTKSLQIIAF